MKTLSALRSFAVAIVRALDVMTGRTHDFTVEHNGSDIHAITYDTGADVPEASEQFTEVALAFELDQFRMMEESDVDPRFYFSY